MFLIVSKSGEVPNIFKVILLIDFNNEVVIPNPADTTPAMVDMAVPTTPSIAEATVAAPPAPFPAPPDFPTPPPRKFHVSFACLPI